MHSSSFSDLALHPSIHRALARQGYQRPTPIQQAAIPEVLAGKDLLATAQTGTGKTAAFSLPMLHRLNEEPASGNTLPRALILTPTRELALQIDESLRNYGHHLPLRTAVVVGGVPAPPQIRKLRQGADIVVATPGRLLDLLNQRHVRLGGVEMLVLDEADRMLDMGFIRDVRKIVSATPRQRQTLFFSATLSREIAQLAADMLNQPAKVEITPSASVSDDIAQQVLFVEQNNKRALLTKMLKSGDIPRALVFTRTKHRANRISRQLASNGISADAIHSNKSQNARQSALAAFDRGQVKVLVATDIVARGIDVEGISHVINYELPNDPESYVHRIGRTARAGAMGTALSFCNAEEVALLKGIEKLTQSPLTAVEDHPFHSSAIAAQRQNPSAPAQRQNQPRGPRRQGQQKNTTRGQRQTATAQRQERKVARSPRPAQPATTAPPAPAPAPLAFGRKRRPAAN
ncbi:MAG: DEAD/DEAH box helicase [Candidatus Latescibacteria bacterium]|nr:DEAD/DEAH box helicase [Candidatus Latescibacterota bacterium]